MLLGAGASERERGYIHSVGKLYDDFENKNQRTRIVEYERAMSELAAQHPSDTEATIFHALSLSAAALPTDKTYANQLKAGGILESLWVKQPDHPGLAHYIIHSYDYPALADKARAAARRYASIAPSAAHALHMPSHTFTRVGMWEESVATNDRSRNAALSTGSRMHSGMRSPGGRKWGHRPPIRAFRATRVNGSGAAPACRRSCRP